jgi:hypothetical protein
MCFLCGTNWVFISQNATFFIVAAVKTSDLTKEESDCPNSDLPRGYTSDYEYTR